LARAVQEAQTLTIVVQAVLTQVSLVAQFQSHLLVVAEVVLA
jgi:hypothetical protein